MTEVSSLTGRLLVATPALADPNFERAVALLLDHDEEGSLGVVLNRPYAGRRGRHPGGLGGPGPANPASSSRAARCRSTRPSAWPSSPAGVRRAGAAGLAPGARRDRAGGPGGAAGTAGPRRGCPADLRRVRGLGPRSAGGRA
ncbi:YqgE/AlgH family protein [Streptomyces thinghirensis]|nr:YqgE/AlgH family protein [Streptomyces thinghirensis]